MEQIPVCDLRTQYHAIRDEIRLAVDEVLEGGHFIMGPNVEELERELASRLGVKYAIALNSGTDALQLALRALKIGPGDEVITTPFTFVATTEAIGIVGARPVFVDVDPDTLNIDPEAVAAAITPRTRAVLPVHLYGTPADMRSIMRIAREKQIAVIEDCAQAIDAALDGKRVGSFGEFGCFSFFPSKNLGAYGDGGLLVTSRDDLADMARMLRAHGARKKYYHEVLGVNSRLDELQAAILRVKLRYLDEWTNNRRRAAARYRELLGDASPFTLLSEPQGAFSVYHQFTVLCPDRTAVQHALAERGIQTMVYYPVPLHLQRVHADLEYAAGDFPVSETAADRVLSLPMFPELTIEQQQRVAQALRSVAPAAV